MIRREVTYTNFDGVDEKKTVYFNISLEDAATLVGEKNKNVIEELKNIGANSDPTEIMASFSQLLEWGYGERDGDQFIKEDGMFLRFKRSLAYDALLAEFMMDTQFAIDFVNNLFPKKLLAHLEKEQAKNEGKTPSQIAREQSEAMLGGHKTKSVEEKRNAFETNPSEVAQIKGTAEPVLEKAEGEQQTPTEGLKHYVDRGQPDFPHIGTPPTVEEVVKTNLESTTPTEVMSESMARLAGLSDAKIEELRDQGLIRQTNP